MTTENNQVVEETEVESTEEAVNRTGKVRKTLDIGKELINNMEEEETSKIGSLEGTIHFVSALGLGSQKQVKKVDGKSKHYPLIVGVKLRTDNDIEVPVIDVLLDKHTGIKASDIGSRKVKKDEEFSLNLYELMFFITRVEYGGLITRGDDTQGVYFSAKSTSFNEGKAKLPTPTINFRMGTGSIKEHIETVDTEVEPKKWEIKPEYAESFGKLIRPRQTRKRGGSKANQLPASVVTSIAINKLITDAVTKED